MTRRPLRPSLRFVLVAAVLSCDARPADRGPDGVYASDDLVATIHPMDHGAYTFAFDGASSMVFVRSGRVFFEGTSKISLIFAGDSGWDEFSYSSRFMNGKRFRRLTPEQAEQKRRELLRDKGPSEP